MAESVVPRPFDEYVDQFSITLGPYGVNLTLLRSSPRPQIPGSVVNPDEVGTIRMSHEHLKVMAYMIKRQIDQVQEQLGVIIPVSTRVLNELRIAPEDWDKFWKRES